MEATGNCHWLVDLLAELGHELWIGDAAQIRASYVRRQKTDKRDAAHILKLLVEGRFPRVVRYRVCKAGWKREAVKNSESDIDVFEKKPNHSGG